MNGCEEFIDLLAATSEGVRNAHQKMINEWLPEEPPITVVFGEFGYQIAENFETTNAEASRQIFMLVESAMVSSNEGLVTAVATGLIEALATRASQSENLWQQIAPFLGPRSLSHAKYWLGP